MRPAGHSRWRLTAAWALVAAGIWALAAYTASRPQDVRKAPRISRTPVEALKTWDGEWYAKIAIGGYSERERRTLAFFPLYPAIARLLGGAGHAPLAGILFSQAAFLACLLLLARHAPPSADLPLVRQPGFWMLVSPLGYYFFVLYTESLFLLLTLLMVWAFRRERFGAAAGLGFLIGLTRPTAVVVPALFAWEVFQRWKRGDRWIAAGLAAAMPVAAVAAYVGAVGFALGDPLGYTKLQEAVWQHTFTIPFYPVLRGTGGFLRDLWNGSLRSVDQVLAILSAAAMFLLLCFGWRRLDPGFRHYALASMAFVHALDPLRSTARYEVVLFPAYLALAQTPLAGSRFAWPAAALLLLAQALLFARHARWNWVA